MRPASSVVFFACRKQQSDILNMKQKYYHTVLRYKTGQIDYILTESTGSGFINHRTTVFE